MIAEHVYSSRFGTFIVNSERERDEVRLLDILCLLILFTNKWMSKAETRYITIIVFDLPKYKDHTLVCFSRYLPRVMRLFGENYESPLRLITVEALS